ncbi:hypothetical protein mRhiFer1_008109 [Rhinolophus ferrumequinum]|uniref:Integrase catalytic domain-containing protein n=1 Tax=Rhinolophus ferrumequinum TaxID=59479 RepID=A0A7J7W7F9_RHIFE|nr:hypothetical protein mRhiFer1_008109 [Rhinolophus ferrumequinum]
MEYVPPAVPNTCTLLSELPAEAGWFTCLDLKDAFFCIRLAPQSQSLYVFEWTAPDTGWQLQLTCTRLPQGFKNSPALFGEVLASDLATFPREEYCCTLLKYVDDLLLACATETECQTATQALLSHLARNGISLETLHTLNPASLLPIDEGDPENDCIEVINEVYDTRPDLQDSPHPNPDLILYTDGSSFLRDGKHHVGSGAAPFEDLKVDFTDMTNCHGTKYLLVLVCTYSGWVEPFPTWTEKSCEGAKVFLREIIPRYGIPLSIHNDNRPAFIAELLQTVTRAMGINWRLHTAYRPQSSGKA